MRKKNKKNAPVAFGKKRRRTEIQEQETEDELRELTRNSSGDLNEQHQSTG